MSHDNDYAVATILGPLQRKWVEFYRRKNKDYEAHGQEFGVKGEVHNLGKKMQKIKRALWDDEPLIGEQPEEILLDMIGHCFQALYILGISGEPTEAEVDAYRNG